MAAAPVSKENILVGAGKLFQKTGADTWRELGGTEDGTEISLPKEFHDVKAAEAPVTLRKELTDMKGMVSFNMLEATLDNYLLAAGQGAIAPAGTLTVGTDGTVKEEGFKLVCTGPSGKVRTYTFLRAVATGTAATRRTKGANASIAAEFELLATWNTVTNRWDFFTVVDV